MVIWTGVESVGSARQGARPFRSRRTVIAGVDGSGSSVVALEWAADEAWARRAALRVVCADTAEPLGTSSGSRRSGSAAAIIADGIAIVSGRHPGLLVQGDTVERPAARALVDASAHADLLVLGARGTGADSSGVLPLGTVARHCLRHARCPLTVAHAGFADPLRASAGSWIIVGIDGSAGSDQALRWALEEAIDRSTSVRAVFVCDPQPIGNTTAPTELDHRTRAIVETALVDAGQWRPGVHFEALALSGPVAPTLLDAGHGAPLLVVGSQGFGSTRPLGSVARLCAYRGNGPVAVVRTLGEVGSVDRR